MKKEYTFYFFCKDCNYEFESEKKEDYCTRCGSENINLIDKNETELC